MTATNIESHPARVMAALIPASAIGALTDLGGAHYIRPPEAFSLKRRKNGTEVGLHCGRLWVNLSIQLSHWPADFVAARAWVKTLEERFSITLPERPRKNRRGLRLVTTERKP